MTSDISLSVRNSSLAASSWPSSHSAGGLESRISAPASSAVKPPRVSDWLELAVAITIGVGVSSMILRVAS